MKISDLGEFGLIRKIQKLASRPSPLAPIGIGDDAAALRVSSSALLLATTDMLLEGIHFDLSCTDIYSLGWKAAAVNLSDIAAMGGAPRFCLTSLGIPSHIKAEQILDFYRGFHALLRTHKTVLVGGDTCASSKGLIISVTILGEVNKKNLLSRAGAKPGDRIFVTNTLGDSAAGLEILKRAVKGEGLKVKGAGGRARSAGGINQASGVRSQESGVRGRKDKSADRKSHSAMRTLIERHLRPIPRIEWGSKIAHSKCASAMIDISDGLSSDLAHICEQSGVGSVVYSDKIPLSAPLLKAASQRGQPALHYALSGGEDYELLFTVPPAKIKRLESLDLPVTEIGTITEGRKLFILNEDGGKEPLRPSGYDHFAHSSLL